MPTKILALPRAALAAVAMLFLAPLHAAPKDDIIVAASDAFQKKDAARLARHIEPARSHLLGQYVEFWALRLAIDERPTEVVRDFLTRHKGAYVAERLRADWLRSLGKRGLWDVFQTEQAALANHDLEINCYVMLSRYRAGDAGSADAFRTLWREPRDLPEGCVAMAEKLAQDSRLHADMVWERARALSEVGQTGAMKRTLAYLPPKESVTPGSVEQILANPQAALEANGFNLTTRSGRELYAFALGRLARRDPQQAATLFTPAIQSKLSDVDRAHVFAQLALPAARSHLAQAVSWYAQTGPAVLSDEQAAWRVRAALRASNWFEVERAVESMGPVQKEEPAWTYWRARALRALEQKGAAQALFAKIAGQHHFYGNLAGEELGIPVVLPPHPQLPTDDEMAAIEQDAGLQRALALMRLQLRTEAVREWAFATRGLSDRQLLAAAELARRNQVWDRAINTADRTQDEHDFRLRYLAPYRDVFAAHAGLYGLDESWVLGLVRQESRFIQNAKSSAGASGLMQLMPNTARLVAQRIGMKKFSLDRVNEPEVNIQLGTSYMRQVLDDLDGHPLLASAGYNAGPRRAQQWRATTPLEGAVYAESIPFNETRDYVKRVFSNTMYYARLQGGEVASLKTRLGTIPPRASGVPIWKADSGS
ncbi:MAG: transglycosylase SLT domain-containing protein [Burkholderiales bacterium]